MTPTELASTWVPVPLRWRHVIAGDVFVGRGQMLWQVTVVRPKAGYLAVTTRCGDECYPADVDPDDRVNVLVPVTEAEAVELTIEQLGARLIERRTLEGT